MPGQNRGVDGLPSTVDAMYRMILPGTLADVVAAEDGSAANARAFEADEAAARTRADYGRVSRWALGLLGTAGALIGATLLSVAVLMVTATTADAAGILFSAIVSIVAAAIAVPSIWLLVALHRSGKRLARAAGYWVGLPYRQGRRTPAAGDWFAVRFVGFSADLFLRLITSVLAALGAIFTITGAIRTTVTGGEFGMILLMAAWSVILVAVCIGQFGGVQRIQNGYLARDPASLTR